MKNPILLLIIFPAILISGCCHKKNIVKQDTIAEDSMIVMDNKPLDDYLKFEAYYYHTTESTYEEVKILNGKLFFTYFKDEKGDCSQWIQQKPCWSEDKLKIRETKLTKADIDSISSKISNFGFWGLDTVIGNPNNFERYYSFVLKYKTALKENSVLFKSVPGGIVMPDAFRRSRDELMKIVRKKQIYD